MNSFSVANSGNYVDLIADSVSNWSSCSAAARVKLVWKSAWTVVASNPSTRPDRVLWTSCKHHDLLSVALLWTSLHSPINCLSSQWTLKISFSLSLFSLFINLLLSFEYFSLPRSRIKRNILFLKTTRLIRSISSIPICFTDILYAVELFEHCTKMNINCSV